MKKLYYGDNLQVLREYVKDESVDLIYLDPPFNSKRDYNLLFKTPKPPKKSDGKTALKTEEPQAEYADASITAFEDTWHWGQQAADEFREILRCGNTDVAELMQALRAFLKENDMMAYLVMMCNRLLELHRVLKPTGSLYLHCDPTASHYLKIVLDGVFGKENYLNEIVWKRTSAHSSARRWGDVHDTLLFYSKGRSYVWNQLYQQFDESHIVTKYINTDHHGQFMPADLTGAGKRAGDSGKPWRNFDPDKLGRHWAIPRAIPEEMTTYEAWGKLSTQEKLNLLDQHDLVYWPKKEGGFPRFKKYLGSGVPIQTVIADISPINSQA